MLILSESDVEALFTLDVAHTAAREAFEALGRGDAVLPERLLVPGRGDDVAFCYAARTAPGAPAVSKFGAVHPGNASRGLDAVNALLTVLDGETGRPAAVMGATALTTRRTAAASAVAVEALSPDDAGDLAVIGSGAQALAHLQAIARVRALTRVRVASRTPAGARKLAARWNDEAPVGAVRAEACAGTEEAVRGANVVVTATTATSPVLADAWVGDAALVVTVGSFSAERSELPGSLVARSRVVVDHRETALADAGCIVQAVASGALDPAGLETLGEVLVLAAQADADAAQERRPPVRPTVYASVGVGAQDAAAAAAVMAAARAEARGSRIEL